MDTNKELINLSNAHLTLTILGNPLSGVIKNKTTGEDWRFDIGGSLGAMPDNDPGENCEVSAVEILNRGAGGAQARAVIGGENFTVSIWLDRLEPDVVFELAPLDGKPSRLSGVRFPGPIIPASQPVAELILPVMATQGLSHRPLPDEEWHKEFMLWEHGLSAPLWGIMSGAGGALTIINTPDDCGAVIGKRRGDALRIEPYWVPSLGAFSYARRMTVCFTQTPHYAEMARRYRRYVTDQGRFKSLKEKIEERPAVGKLLGAPYVYVGYQPLNENLLKRVMDGMKALGYDTCLFGPITVNAWDNAWMNDYVPLIQMDRDVYRYGKELGYLPYAWEWLEDMMESSRFYNKDMPYILPDGEPMKGWSNRDYRYRLVCSRMLAENYTKLAPEIECAPALHMDVTTHIPVRECWRPDHRVTRAMDIEYKRERMRGYAAAGKVFGSEGGYDWAFDLYDFCSTNPRIGSLIDSDNFYIPVPNRLIPFLSIVYHDSVLMYWYEQDTYMRDRNDMMKWFHGVEPGPENYEYRDKLLFDIMAGNPPTLSPCGCVFNMNLLDPKNPIELKWVTYDDPRTQRILRDALPVAQNHARYGLLRIDSQQYLDEPRLVSRTVYEDGTAFYVNFGCEPFRTESGETVPGRDWIVSVK